MNRIPMNSKRFQSIVQFYLLECPVRKRITVPVKERDPADKQAKYKYRFVSVSKRGVTFQDRGLDGSNLNVLRAAMIRISNVYLQAFEHDIIVPDCEEYIVIKRNEQSVSVTEGYFYCIRNALAHGDFDINNRIYTLRNESGGVLKGKARLREKTLLDWIELINKPLDEIKVAGR